MSAFTTLPFADDAEHTLQLSPAVRLIVSFATVVVAGSWLGFYLITGLPYISLETFKETITLHAVTGVVLIPYLCALVARRKLPGGSPLDVPVAALLGVYLLTTATSLNWRVSLEVSMTGLMAISVFYVLSDGGLVRRWQIQAAFMLATLALAFRSLWVVGDDYLAWLRLTHAVHGSYDFFPPTVPKIHDVGDHPNLVGGILAMALPFFVCMTFRRSSVAMRLACALGAIVISLAVFLSLARSAWLGAIVGTGVSQVLLLLSTAGGKALLHRLLPDSPARRLALGSVALLLAAVVIGGALAVRAAESRPIWLFRESASPRQDLVEAGAAMIRDHPLAGTGPGVFGLLYPKYSGIDPVHAIHAHNGFLQVAVDMGVPGVLAMFALLSALAWLLYRGLRRTEGDARLTIIACTGGFTALAIFSLFDAPNGFKGPLVAIAAVGSIAVLSCREGREPAAAVGRAALTCENFGLAARAIVPIALAGLLITWARLDMGHYQYSNSLGSANAGHWEQAIESGQRAVELDPQFVPYRLQLGVELGEAYLLTNDSALLDNGVAQLQRAVALEPQSAIGHANLARLLEEAGSREGARDEALTAIRYANSDVAIVAAAATVLEDAGWSDEAIDAYSQVLYLDLDLADSPFWSSTDFRKQHFEEFLRHSVLIFSPCAILHLQEAGAPVSALGDGVPGCARHVLDDPGDQAAKVTLAQALMNRGERDEPRALLDDTLRRQPDFGPGRTALGRWYANEGDLAHAREEWVRAGQLDQTDALVYLGDSYPASEVPSQVVSALRERLIKSASDIQFDLPSVLYFRFKFFRGSPIQILLPGDWQQAAPGPYVLAEKALKRWTSQ